MLPTGEARAEGVEHPRGVEEEGGSAEEDSGVSGAGGEAVADVGGDQEDGEEEDGVVMSGDGEGEAGEEGEVRPALPRQASCGGAADEEGVAAAFGGIECGPNGDDGRAKQGAADGEPMAEEEVDGDDGAEPGEDGGKPRAEFVGAEEAAREADEEMGERRVGFLAGGEEGEELGEGGDGGDADGADLVQAQRLGDGDGQGGGEIQSDQPGDSRASK